GQRLRDLPNGNATVVTGAGQTTSVGSERHLVYGHIETVENSQQLARLEVPNADVAIIRAGHQPGSTRMERQPANDLLVVSKLVKFAARGNLPHLDSAR